MSDESDPVKPDPDKKPKRPADANQRAKMIVDLATGETEEGDGKDENKEPKGQAGGKARAAKLTAQQRSEIAKKAAAKRWGTDS